MHIFFHILLSDRRYWYMSELILTESKDRILRIQLNRPKKKNALNMEMYSAIGNAIKEGEADPSIRVILVHGQPDYFCAGNDIASFQDVSSAAGVDSIRNFYNALTKAKKPLIAAVNGFAIGVGMTMLLHFDLVYAGQSATFRAPFVDLALCPDMGSSYILPRMLGYHRAVEIFFFSETLTAERAYILGYINRIFPDDVLLEQSIALARHLAEKPPASIRITKKLLKEYSAEKINQADIDEFSSLVKQIGSREAQEAFQAFLEKRAPDFSKFK